MKYTFFLLAFCFFSCSDQGVVDQSDFSIALENAELANESYVRSLDFVKGWMLQRDSASGLIPSNLNKGKDIWDPHNAAADNYAFMVLTAYLLDRDLYDGPMLEMLRSEKKLTSRVGALPDTYSFSKQDFTTEELNMGKVIFGTSEYIKDGLLPLMEYIGPSPWNDRMMEMLDDLSEHLIYLEHMEKFDYYHAPSEEVNGEMLQTLSRVYWMTGEEKYLDWAIKIGDYYMLGERDLSQIEYLRIRDHGCEIISGLSELYVMLHFAKPEKKEQYKEAYHHLLDRILEVGLNEDGLFYNAVNMASGEVVDKGIVDNWGYTFDAYYSVFLVDGVEEYRQAFLGGMQNLNEKYRDYRWEGNSHDGYADALESGINLYNREPIPHLRAWIDSEMKVMWNMQREDGIIGGWHGDGNFARTAIMYALWKTQGLHCYPWREDVKIGAERKDGKLFIAISSQKDWKGKLVFDFPRHKEILKLPIDYPRINQFPEWFTIEKGKSYSIQSSEKKLSGEYRAAELLNGLKVKLKAGNQIYILISQLD